MKYQLKAFNQLTVNELYGLLKIRFDVFVLEQECLYDELDGVDKKAYHMFVEDHHEVIATLRLFKEGVESKEARIGRVAIDPKARGKGIAREMMVKAMSYAKDEMDCEKVRISAQSYLLSFYESMGFHQISDEFLEDGIAHIEMLYQK